MRCNLWKERASLFLSCSQKSLDEAKCIDFPLLYVYLLTLTMNIWLKECKTLFNFLSWVTIEIKIILSIIITG